ncbi:hypothetical protein KY334_03635 [Candidatus Woesearchaeota archaeon]|nr:hypothetical protein [Candidatus Woesearchaeota archaeon]
MIIDTKAKNYELWNKGLLGNKLRTWDSYEDIIKSNYEGTVTVRNKNPNSKFCKYDVSIKDIPNLIKEWSKEGCDVKEVTYNESAPDEFLLIQGEIMKSNEFYYFRYSTEKTNMRDALKNAKDIEGLEVEMLLKKYMDSASYDDLMILLDTYPDHVVEFSVYSIDLGEVPNRNTIFWEVRKY